MSIANDAGGADVIRPVQAAQDALTDSMVERLAVTGANVMEVANALNDDDTKEAILSLIEKLTEMHKTGALDTLFQLVAVMHAAKEASTDSIVERLFQFVESMVTNLANEEVAEMAHGLHVSMQEAAQETSNMPASGGLFSTMSMLSKPETQKSLQFLLSFSSKMQAHCCD